ncbi:carbohydrate ABC transporter substrate-binding protein, partial [Streptomyces sp. NPDC005568]
MGNKQTLTGALLALTMLTVAGCSGQGAASGEEAKAPADPADASGTIKVLTHRTDLVQDGTMARYAAEFNKIYPEVKVKFEALT